MSTKDIGKTLVRGSTYFIVGHVVTLFLDLLTSVFLARVLEESGYGLWQLAWSSFGIFMLLQGLPGTQFAIVRYVSKYSTEKKLGLTRSIILTSIKIDILSIGLSCGVTILLANYTANMLNHPELAILLTIFAIGHSTFAIKPTEVFTALKKFHYTVGLNILGSALRFLSIATFVTMGYGIVGAAIGQALFSVVISLLTFLFVITRFLPSKPQSNDNSESGTGFISTSRKILAYGIPLSLTALISSFNANFRNLMLGNVNGLAILGYFTVAMHITNLMRMPLQLVTGPLFPIISELETREERKEIDKLLSTLFKNMVLLVATTVIFVELFASQIVCFIYSEAFLYAASFLRLLVLINFPLIVFYLSDTLFQGVGRSDIVLKMNGISMFWTIPGYMILIPCFGALGLTLFMVVETFSFSLILYIHFLRKTVRRIPFSLKSLAKLVPSLGVLTIFLLLVRPFILHNAIYLVISGPLTLLVSFVLACFAGVIKRDELQILKISLPSALQRNFQFVFSFLEKIARE